MRAHVFVYCLIVSISKETFAQTYGNTPANYYEMIRLNNPYNMASRDSRYYGVPFEYPSQMSATYFEIASPRTNFPEQGRESYFEMASPKAGFTSQLAIESFPQLPRPMISIAAEGLVINGAVTVTGSLPFLGAVTVEGELPTFGMGSVQYGADNGEVGIYRESTSPERMPYNGIYESLRRY